MLYLNTLYDIDARFEDLQNIKKSDVEEALALTFENVEGKKSVALVGNTDKPFPLL